MTTDRTLLTLHPCQIGVNPDNPAHRIDHTDPELIELADSIRVMGIIQPITVRKTTNGTVPPYEVIMGARRLHGAILAGLTTIQVVLRELDNETAADFRAVENMIRQNLTPMEEATELLRMVQNRKLELDDISKALGISKHRVAQTLSLNLLIPEWKKLFDPITGTIPADVPRMALIARYPPETQKKFLGMFTDGRKGFQAILQTNLRDLGTTLDTMVVNSLPGPWGAELEEKGCGSCLACMKRAKALPELFPDLSAKAAGKDSCLDPACYTLRMTNHVIRQKLAVEAQYNNRQILAEFPLSHLQREWYAKANLLCISGYDMHKAKKDAPGAMPVITHTGKTRWVDVKKIGYLREKENTIVNQWKPTAKRKLKPPAKRPRAQPPLPTGPSQRLGNVSSSNSAA